MHRSTTRGTSASRPNPQPQMSSSYGYNNRMTTSISTSVKSPDPSFNIEGYVSTNMKAIHSLLPGFQNKVSDKIKFGFNSYMRADGRQAKTLFSIGFLLLQDIISQGSSLDAKNRQRFLLGSFSSFTSYMRSEIPHKSFLTKLHSKLETFLMFAGRLKGHEPSSLDDPAEAAKLICEECKKDKDLVTAIVYMARCSLGEAMVKEGLNKTMMMVFSKLTNPAWESDDQYAEELYKVLSICFKYTVNLFTVKDTSCNEKSFPCGNSPTANFLDYSSRVKEFRAILFKGIDAEPNQKSTDVSSSQNSSMLNRSQNKVEERFTTGSLLSSSSKMSTAVNIEPQIPAEQVEECSLCGQEILRHFIYTNPACLHNYCYYCLQDIVDSHTSLKFCYLKKCPKSLSQNDIKEFMRKRNEEEKAKPSKIPSMHGVPEEGPINQQPSNITTTVTRNNRLGGEEIPSRLSDSSNYSYKRPVTLTCSCCDQDVNENNPIVYTNEKCGHTFCKNWFILYKPTFEGDCFRPKCMTPANFEKVKEALSRCGIQSFPMKCSKCHKIVDSERGFINSSCQHRLCVSCADKIVSIFCPLSSCPGNVDEEKLFLFKRNLLEEEDTKHLDQKTVTCPSCNHQVTLFLPGGSKTDYWKCPDCSKMFCSQHNQEMSKCLCLCPKCLGTVSEVQSQNAKDCSKCSVSYCLKCGKENKPRETCSCSISVNTMSTSTPAVVESKNIVEPKNGKTSPFAIDPSAKPKVHPNTCSICSDFRDSPEYLKLGCGHKICEYCVIVKREEFAKAKAIKCVLCSK